MSRLSLMETLQLLEKEFEEAESSYSLDSRVEQGVVDVEWTVDEDLEVISPPSVEESELPTEDTVILGDPILSQPVMASSFVNDDSTSPLEPSMIEVPESFSSAPDQAVVRLELSDEDKKEVDVVESFMDKTCGCKGGPAKTPCSMLFIKDVVMSYRSDCFALKREQLDLVVTAQLSAFCTHKSSIPPSYRGSADNFRPHTNFLFRGIRICLEMFVFLHGMSKHRFVNICHHFDAHGLSERVHGNAQKRAHNTSTPDQLENLVTFIDNIAQAHAMPLPGRLPNHRDDRALLLPTDLTKAKVFRMYLDSCASQQTKPVGRTKFHTVWTSLRPYVCTMKPADDLCLECQTLCKSMTNTGHLSEEQKEERVKAYTDHLDEAKQERQNYNDQIAMCRDTIGEEGGCMHYSYDFAQQIHYPNNPLQPGPAYFLTARKCQIFGIACEPTGSQVNYLIDEADNVGKGANCTISLVHHYLGVSCLS